MKLKHQTKPQLLPCVIGKHRICDTFHSHKLYMSHVWRRLPHSRGSTSQIQCTPRYLVLDQGMCEFSTGLETLRTTFPHFETCGKGLQLTDAGGVSRSKRTGLTSINFHNMYMYVFFHQVTLTSLRLFEGSTSIAGTRSVGCNAFRRFSCADGFTFLGEVVATIASSGGFWHWDRKLGCLLYVCMLLLT